MISVQAMKAVGIFSKAIRLQKGTVVPPHFHFFDHQSFVVRGSAELGLDGELTTHKALSMVYVPAKARHSFRALEDDTVIVCQFAWRDAFGRIVDDYKKIDWSITGGGYADENDPEVKEIFKRITSISCGACDGCE